MKPFWKKALLILLVFVLIVSGSLCFVLTRKQKCSHPFPMWLEVFDETGLESPEHITLKYDSCSFEPSTPEWELLDLCIECTLTEQTQRWQNHFRILYQEEGGSTWYMVYSHGLVVQAVSAVEPPGTTTLSCLVPRRLFYHRGSYKIVIPDRGSCDLPRKKLWTGPDEECGQRGGIHTESGFPMYRESRLAGSAEDYSDEGLIATEVIQGDETDTLKLTIEVQGNTKVDNGFFFIFFCPPNGDKLVEVYQPAEWSFYDFYESETRRSLDPGLNTVEYPVQKGLFQQAGDYYISCSVGQFKLFGD